MIDNKLQFLLKELKTKVKESSGKIGEEKLINMINLIARTEMNLKQNGNSSSEKIEIEILRYIKLIE